MTGEGLANAFKYIVMVMGLETVGMRGELCGCRKNVLCC